MRRHRITRLSGRLIPVLGAAALLTAAPAAMVAQQAADAAVPRTANGQPDISGVWDFRTLTPLQRPQNQGETIDEARARELEEAAAERARAADQPSDPEREALKAGGDVGAYNNFWFDRGAKVVDDLRTSLIIDPPDGRLPATIPDVKRQTLGDDLPPDRAHLPDSLRQWMGDSRGRWEGDTLVVETKNFTDRISSFSGSPFAAIGTGYEMQITEKFRRIDEGTLMYEYTVNDPATYTRPFTARLLMKKSDVPMFEYACHEGNYGLHNMLSGARAKEAEASAATGGG